MVTRCQKRSSEALISHLVDFIRGRQLKIHFLSITTSIISNTQHYTRKIRSQEGQSELKRPKNTLAKRFMHKSLGRSYFLSEIIRIIRIIRTKMKTRIKRKKKSKKTAKVIYHMLFPCLF